MSLKQCPAHKGKNHDVIMFVTNNTSKHLEAESIFRKYNIRLQQKALHIIEYGTNQEEVVISKAEQAFFKLQATLIVDDSCLYIKEYDNFPGIYTKRLFKERGFEYFKDLIYPSKSAYFQTIVCFKENSLHNELFYGVLNGTLVACRNVAYTDDWPYNNFFIPENTNKYLSDYSIEERATFSHRSQALEKAARHILRME